MGYMVSVLTLTLWSFFKLEGIRFRCTEKLHIENRKSSHIQASFLPPPSPKSAYF